MKLSLKIPEDNTFDKLTEAININNPNMLYWFDSYYDFCKTSKPNTPKCFDQNLVKEKEILLFLENKDYTKCISPPSRCDVGPYGNLIIVQKAFYEGDLFQYIQRGNSGIDTGLSFLESVKFIFKSFQNLKIIHGDLSLENFMIDTSKDGLRCVLVDFGCSEIFIEDKIYEWNFKNYEENRPYMNSPDLQISYSEPKMMTRDDIYDLLTKKEMFSIGILLYNVVFGLGIWITDKEYKPETKLEILKKIRINIELKYKKCECNRLKKVFELLLGLLPLKLENMISLDKLYMLIDDLSESNNNSRKRKFSNH